MDYYIFLAILALVFVATILVSRFLFKRTWQSAIIFGLIVTTLTSTALDLSEGMIGEPLRVAAIDSRPRLSNDPWYKFTTSVILWVSLVLSVVLYLLLKLVDFTKRTGKSRDRSSSMATRSHDLVQDMELVKGIYCPVEKAYRHPWLTKIKTFWQKHHKDIIFLTAIGLLVEFLAYSFRNGINRCRRFIKQGRSHHV